MENTHPISRLLLRAALAVILAAAPSAFAQAPQPLQPPALPPEIQSQLDRARQEMATEDPYWQETVDRALEQLRTGNAEQRRSAVMLLGKYPAPPAQAAVSEALADSDAAVRRAALVSLLEAQTPIPPETGARMLALLADPDVSIRRIASNAAPMMLRFFSLTMNPGDLQPQRNFPPAVDEAIRKAFRDPDAAVRRNMVQHYPYLRVSLPQETLVALLHDSDPEVAIHAVRWALPLLDEPTLAAESSPLAENENPLFRLEIARALQHASSPAARSILEKLEQDPHDPVAIEAMLSRFRRDANPELYRELVDRYRQSSGNSDAAQRIIFSAQLLGPAGESFLREWMNDENPAHRQHATQAFLSGYGTKAETGFLLSLLDDSTPVIRQQVMQLLMRGRAPLSPEQIRSIAAHRYPDVRRLTAQLTAVLPQETAENLLMELLLDDQTEVRVAALQQIASRRISGWEEILLLSLHEENPAITQTSLVWLTRQPTPQILQRLADFVSQNPNSSARPRIDAFLQQHSARVPN